MAFCLSQVLDENCAVTSGLTPALCCLLLVISLHCKRTFHLRVPGVLDEHAQFRFDTVSAVIEDSSRHLSLCVDRKNKLSCAKTGSVSKLTNEDPDQGQP